MLSQIERPSVWIRLTGAALGILVFAAGNWIDYYPGRYVARLIGVGLIFVFAVGGVIDRGFLTIFDKIDNWIRHAKHRASILLVLMILTGTFIYGRDAFLKHYYFHSGHDLGNQDQVTWNTSQGRPFARSIEVTNDLGDHVRPYLALLAAIYLVIPSPYVLLGFQSFILGLSAWPLYRLAERKFSSPSAGLTVVFCALAYPPLVFLNRFDFHAEVVAVPLLTAAYERFDANDLKKASLFLGLALLGKENIGLTVAAMGLTLAFFYRRWLFGLTWAIVGAGYSLTALLIIIPWFRGSASDTLARYQWLGNTPLEMLITIVSQPATVWNTIAGKQQLATSLQLLGPLGFLSLLHFPALFPAITTLGYNFIASYAPQHNIYSHYMAPVIPFMSIAAVLGLHWITDSVAGRKLLRLILAHKTRSVGGGGLGLSIMIVATLAMWRYEGGMPFTASHPIRDNDAAIREALKYVPERASLITTGNFRPHLAHRESIAPIYFRPRMAPVPEPSISLGPKIEAIFLNLHDVGDTSCDAHFQILKLAADSGFGATFYRDGVVLVEKNKGNVRRLQDLLYNWPGCK